MGCKKYNTNSTWTCDLEDLCLPCLWFFWIFRSDWVWPDSIMIWSSWPKSNSIKLEPSSEFDSNSNFSNRNSDQIGLGYLPTLSYNDVFSNGFLNTIIVLLNRSSKTKYSICIWNEIWGRMTIFVSFYFYSYFYFQNSNWKKDVYFFYQKKMYFVLKDKSNVLMNFILCKVRNLL